MAEDSVNQRVRTVTCPVDTRSSVRAMLAKVAGIRMEPLEAVAAGDRSSVDLTSAVAARVSAAPAQVETSKVSVAAAVHDEYTLVGLCELMV